MKNIRDKVILVTGGASGIGRLMAFDFAARGAKVIIWDINADAVKAVEGEAFKEKLFVRGMVCDVSDREDVYSKADKLVKDFGAVDVLVNNAGIVSKKETQSGPAFLGASDDNIIKIININVLSLFWTCKAFLPSMIERNCGHIVTVSSAAGIVGVKGLTDYCASKFAAFGFDESVRMNLRSMKSKVMTTVACPFFIDTGMFSGVKTSFPLLLPILKSEYAARKIVCAVIKNKRRLLMPRFVYSVFLLRLFPVKFLDWVADLTGISHSMDDFTGRPPRG